MLEGFPACRIAFDSMAEVACEAAKVAYKEKIGDLQSASVEERPGGADASTGRSAVAVRQLGSSRCADQADVIDGFLQAACAVIDRDE